MPDAVMDADRLTFHLLPLPKGVKGTRAAGFLGHEPAGTYAKSTNKTFLCTSRLTIALGTGESGVPVGPEAVYAATLWTGKKNTPQAVAWTIRDKDAIGCALPAPGFGSSHATAVAGLDVVGTGESPGDGLSRALLWKAGAAPVVLANPGDPKASTAAHAVSGDLQGGSSGGMAAGACIWRGSTESFVSLHPKDMDASCVRPFQTPSRLVTLSRRWIPAHRNAPVCGRDVRIASWI